MTMPNAASNLGMQLGQLIFGNPGASDAAFLQGQQAGALVNDRMASARAARARAMIDEDRYGARTDITPDVIAKAGYSSDQAPLLGAILRSNDSVDLSKLGALANPTAGAALADADAAMRSGNMGLGNALLAAASGKPLETTKVTDGQAFNPYGTPDQPVSITALGQATIGDKNASAMQHRAGAAENMAHARLFDKQTAVGGFNPNTGGDNAAPPVVAPNPNGPHGDNYLGTLDPTTAAQVKALAEGRMAFPSGTALKSDYWQAMLQHVAQFDPSFDQVNYNARAGTRKAFTSGKEAAQVNALNTVAEHLGTLSENVQGLDNTQFPVVNRVKNWLAAETGDPDIARFNTSKKAVADEVAKVWRQTGGSEADIQENLRNLDGAQSPAQLNAALGTLIKLIGGKVAALQDQYNAGMGTTQNPRPLVSEKARGAFDTVLQRAGMGQDENIDSGASLQAVGAPPPLGQATRAPSAPAMPKTDAEYALLPSGALFIDPDDGKTYRKP